MKEFFIKRWLRKSVWGRLKTIAMCAVLFLLVMTGQIKDTFRQVKSSLSVSSCPVVSFSSTPLPRIALASYPGAGNTWVRHLIQKMTGIATGNVFSDGSLKRGGFPGEGIKDGSVVVIKTHLHFNETRYGNMDFQRVILVVRNPYEVLLSEYRREQTTDHTGIPKIDRFKHWDRHVNAEIIKFRDFYLSWLRHRDVFPLFYDDLKMDLPNTLWRLLAFLEEANADGNIQCALDDPDGHYHRDQSKLLPKEFFYSDEKIKIIDYVILELYEQFQKRFSHTSFDMKKWLMK